MGFDQWRSDRDGKGGWPYSNQGSDLGPIHSCLQQQFPRVNLPISRIKLVGPSGQATGLIVLSDLGLQPTSYVSMEPVLYGLPG